MGNRMTLRERWEDRVRVAGPDECWLWVGALNPQSGYGMIWDDHHVKLYAHRVAVELFDGPIAPGMYVDHMCHVPRCVNPRHLRCVTNKQNVENRGVLNSNSTSGFRGVSFDKRRLKWYAQAGSNGKHYFGGYFSTPEEANEAAIALRNQIFTHNDADRAA